MNEDREYSPKRFAISSVACPSCHVKLERDAMWCPTCGFTGAKSLAMFGDSPPPLMPILDVANLWDGKGRKKIAAAVNLFGKRFPQIRWRICAVALGQEISLPLFGFWLTNVCPLMPDETEDDRLWTILLLVDANSGRASVTTGYRAEVWLSDEMWATALAEVTAPFRRGDPALAVTAFLKSSRTFFEKAWKRSQKQLTPSPDK